MGRVKNAGKRIMAWLLAACMIMSVMPPVEAKAATSISGAEITFWNGDTQVNPDTFYTYTGAAIIPTVQVRVAGQLLMPGTDYTLTCANNTNSGTATVTVLGNGNYGDSCSKNFVIHKVSLDTLIVNYNDARVQDATGNQPYMFYNGGSALEPTMMVRGLTSAGTLVDLTQNDYTISYDNNTTVSGTQATVTVALKADSNYSSIVPSVQRKFYIYYNLNADTVTANIGAMTYNGDVVVPASFTVSDSSSGRQLAVDTDYTVGNWTEKVNAGQTSITIYAKADSSYRGNKTFIYTIAPYDISSATIDLINGPYYYTGTGSSKLDMTDNVQVKIGDFVVDSKDYTVSYLEGSNGNIGNNWLTVAGKNNLTGSKNIQFSIVQGIESAEIENQEISYSGKAVTLSDLGITVKDAAGEEVGSDSYDVFFYSDAACTEANKVMNPTAVGDYYLKIKAKGSYVGELLGEAYKFSIVRESFDNCKFSLYYYNGSDHVISIPQGTIVTEPYRVDGIYLRISGGMDGNNNSLVAGADKDYTYGVYSDEGCTQELAKTATGENYVISKAGTYYIKVTSTGIGNYGEGEQKFQFKVAPLELTAGSVTIEIADKMYTGSAIVPSKDEIEVSFTDSSSTKVTLEEDDYEIVSVTNNVSIQNKNNGAPDAKIPTVVIRLRGNYTLGTDTATGAEKTAEGYFSIIPRKVSNCQCNLVVDSANYDPTQLSRAYTGAIQKPTILITDEGKTLTEGVDYDVTYKRGESIEEPCNVGTYNITITGKGNYASAAADANITATFTITEKSIAGLSLSVADVDYNGGNAIAPSAVTISLTDGLKNLIRDTDYEVEGFYTNEVCTSQLAELKDAGLVYVKLQGKGNYSGEKVGSFHIGKDLTQYVRGFDVSGWTYDVASNGMAVSYYTEIHSEIQQKISTQSEDVKYTVTYYKDSDRTETILSSDAAFSSAGTIYYRITGTDGYYGSVDGTATIAKKPLSELKAEIVGDYIYSEGTTVTYYDAGTGKGVKVYAYTSEDNSNQHVLENAAYQISNGTAYTNAGTYTIILAATAGGNYSGTKSIPFTIQAKEISSLPKLKVTVESKDYCDKALMPTVILTYGDSGTTLNASNYMVELYKEKDFTTRATEEDRTNAGTTYVKVIGTGNYTGTILTSQYKTEDAINGTVEGSNAFVIKPKDISGVKVDIENQNYIYSADHNLQFVVTQEFPQGNVIYTKTLKIDTDYTYEMLTPPTSFKVGAQTVTLTGKGNYQGSKSFIFYYAGNLNDPTHATIRVGDGSSTVKKDFTGNAITLENGDIVVTAADAQVLTENSEYIVTYKNNTEPGQATVSITGIKDAHWTGTVETHFDIIGNLGDANYTEVIIPDQLYTGSAYNSTTQPVQGMVVKFHGQVLTAGVDYEIVPESFQNATNVTSGGTPASLTIKAKEGGYFVGQVTKEFNIKYDSSKLVVTLDKTSWDYNDGNAIEPAVTVNYRTGGTDENPVYDTLEMGTDYTISYYNNKAVGSANGTAGPYVMLTPVAGGKITGGSRAIPFTINKIDLSQCKVGGVDSSYLYTGSMIKPNTMVIYKKDGTTVIDSSNYTVTYRTNASNPTMAPAGATETITITGQGNYTGTLTKQFIIKSRDLSNPAQATCTIEDQTYSARGLTPDVCITILDENGEEVTLKADTDYTVAGYYNNVNAAEKTAAGAPYASICGVGSCTGNLNVLFTIKKRNMEDLVYSQVENPQYVPGQTEYRPEVEVYMSVTDVDSKLTAGREYRITYYNNTAVLEKNGTSGPYIQFDPIDTNNYEGSHQIYFSILPKDISSADIKVSLADTADSGFDSKNRNYVYDKDKANYSPLPTVTFDDGTTSVTLTDGDYSINYESNTRIGTGYVVLTGIGNYTGERKEAFTIGTLISNDTVTITGVSDKVYNGQDTTPTDLKVKFNAKNEYLKEQTADTVGDYTVGYYLDAACQNAASLANMQNAGRIYVAITGTADENAGGYVGTAVVSYEITRKSLTSSDIVVQGNDDVDYTGSAVYPENLQLIDTTTGRVIDPVYYTVTYENNVEIGTASATITASETGNYKDSITVYYRVTKHSINNAVAEAIPDQTYTGNYIIPELTIYDNGKRLVKGVDYEVVNGNNLRAGESWVIIKGLGNYDQTKKVYFNIVASLETAIVDDIPDQLYTGNPVTPTERVACGGNTLVRGVDYTVSYANNVAVGDASITIRPLTQYYTGTIVKKFTITNSIAGATVTGIPASYQYTGEAFVPEPVVSFNGVVLTKNVDYTVVYRNNVNVGTASVIVSGMGKYSGSKTVNFTIGQKSIEACSIYMVSSQNFTGKLITPPVVVKDGNKALTQGIDYVVSYSNNLDVGTGNATIVGWGDYQGTVTKQFKIEAQDPISNVLVQNKNESEGTFDVLIDGTAVYVDSIRIRVWAKADQSDAYSYSAERVDGDTFIARVNAANHGNTSGTYQIAVYASGQNYGERQAYQVATLFQPIGQNTTDQSQGEPVRGSWKQSATGWWYEYEDGGYVANDWLELDGTWYYFDGAGYMRTGWQQIGGSWYYFGIDGCMRTGWQQIGGSWYYLKDSGAMATGWQQIGGTWYYLKSSGAMATGWQQIGGTWYYLKDNGAMVTGWIKSGNTWYYMKDSGAMATGWQQIGGAWYYMYSSGAMATNTWIGRDYVNASGAWTISR